MDKIKYPNSPWPSVPLWLYIDRCIAGRYCVEFLFERLGKLVVRIRFPTTDSNNWMSDVNFKAK